jgi:hypothetical protein
MENSRQNWLVPWVLALILTISLLLSKAQPLRLVDVLRILAISGLLLLVAYQTLTRFPRRLVDLLQGLSAIILLGLVLLWTAF